jgi:hypothetical protein
MLLLIGKLTWQLIESSDFDKRLKANQQKILKSIEPLHIKS